MEPVDCCKTVDLPKHAHRHDAAKRRVQFSSSCHTTVWSHLCSLWRRTSRWLPRLLWMLCEHDVWSQVQLSTPEQQTQTHVGYSLNGENGTDANDNESEPAKSIKGRQKLPPTKDWLLIGVIQEGCCLLYQLIYHWQSQGQWRQHELDKHRTK